MWRPTLRRAQASQRYGARLAQVASISAGDGVVTVTLSSANTGFPALLDIPIVKSGTEAQPDAGGHRAICPRRGRPDGPCRLVGGGSRPVDRIVLSAARDWDTVLYQFSSHDIQLITADLTGTDPISATGSISYVDADTTILEYVGFNTRREVFQDPAVRRALGLGLNRDTLASAVLSGMPGPPSSRCPRSPPSIRRNRRSSTPTMPSPPPWRRRASPPAKPGR